MIAKKPDNFRGRPIIQPGEVYEIDGINYEVITATSDIIGSSDGNIAVTQLTYVLEDTATKERTYIGERELYSKFKEDA